MDLFVSKFSVDFNGNRVLSLLIRIRFLMSSKSSQPTLFSIVFLVQRTDVNGRCLQQIDIVSLLVIQVMDS